MGEVPWTCRCRVGDCVAAVSGRERSLQELAVELYRGARVHAGSPAVRLRLERQGDQLVLLEGGVERCRTHDPSELFQEAEATLTAAFMAALPRYYQLHAGGVARSGRAWLVVGPPESGKTSLVVALALGGATVLTDEVALLEAPSLRVEPFRRDLIVRAGTWSLFPELSDRVDLPPFKHTDDGRYVSPALLDGASAVEPAALELLVFPELHGPGGARLRRLGQAEAARRLLAQSFNLDSWRGGGVELVASLVERCPAWAVRFADARDAAARLLDSEVVALL